MSTTLTRVIMAVAIFTLMIFGAISAEAQAIGRSFDVAQSPESECSKRCQYDGIVCDGKCICCGKYACPGVCVIPDGKEGAGRSA